MGLKTRHSLENNPSSHNEHPQRHSREKENVYIGISGNVKGPDETLALRELSARAVDVFKLGFNTVRNNSLPRDFKMPMTSKNEGPRSMKES